jgi:hypothetical protein
MVPHSCKNPSRGGRMWYFRGFKVGRYPVLLSAWDRVSVPAEITEPEPPKISGGQNHKYDGNIFHRKEKLLGFRLVETFFVNIKVFQSYDQFNTTT